MITHMKNIITRVLFFGFFVFFPATMFADETTNIPQAVVGSSKNEGAFLQWLNVTNASDYIIEYKESTDQNWNIYEDEYSAIRGVNVLNLQNNLSYDFRVSAIVDGELSNPSYVISVIPKNQFDNENSNTQIISTGQSNALGSFALPYLSTVQPYNNKMLNSDRSTFIPLIEPATGVIDWATGESMSSGLANSITSFTGGFSSNYFPIIMSLRGYGGLTYTDLMQGTSYYNELIQDVISSTNLSIAENRTNIVRGLTVVHGESDESNSTTAGQYEDYLLDWQNDYEIDVKNITGQEESVPLFLNQISSHHSFGHAAPTIALAQLSAAINNPDKIILVAPSYIFDSNDWMSHMTNYSYRRLGEYFAKAYKKVVIDGEEWKPLMPEEVTISGNIIQARFHVPVPPLVFDTSAVLFKQNYGFEYYDENNSATISSVQIINNDTVQITLSNIPTGQNKRLRYAYTGNVGSWTGSHISTAPRGNLRDSDMTEAPHQDGAFPSYFGNYLHNWSVTFDESINDIGLLIPDSPENVVASLGQSNGSAFISFDYPENNNADYFIVKSIPGNLTTTTFGLNANITGLQNNTVYNFKVVAVNSYGESEPSYSNNIETRWTEYPVYPTIPGSISVGNNPRRKPVIEKPVKPVPKKDDDSINKNEIKKDEKFIEKSISKDNF
ncbi:MAG: fibronectin type III domain-containing protein [Candidatus Paceibacterota bacterium]